MLYIFQVDTGQMLCFEMDIAVSTVNNLKSTIASTHGIPIDKQVLLVSGGEILESNSRVCNYAAGTDTNPIFLFNKLNIEGGGGLGGGTQGLLMMNNELTTTPTNNFCGNNSSVVDGNNVQMADQETINKQIEQANTLPPTYMSVVTRAQLAQHIYEMGKEITRKCEVLIHHQHLQHQGWAAVVANLDDIVQLFNSKLNAFVSSYEGFCSEYTSDKIDAFVDCLDPTLRTLEGIKLLPQQQQQQQTSTKDQHTQQNQSIVNWLSEHYTTTPGPSNNTPTSSSSSFAPLHSYLQSIALSTRKTYDHITSDNFLQSLQNEATSVSEKAASPNMKEIVGLEQRLYGLDQLLQEAKHLVVDQLELTTAFHQNVNRASDLRDSSIFPDLCASHQHQLLVMQKNHGQLEDIRRRCGRAKEELTYNLNTRLKWIAFVQKNLSETGGKIGVFHESLKRLRVNVNVLQQIHECEAVYNEYVKETQVRGGVYKKLKTLVLSMAEFNSIVERENCRRETFRGRYGAHFLSQAFSVLVEDKRIELVSVPKLTEYEAYVEDNEHEDESVSAQQPDPEKLAIIKQLKELDQTNSMLKEKLGLLEAQLIDKSRAAHREQDAAKDYRLRYDSAVANLSTEKKRADKLEHQVDDLKKLIDEFRVKEDESIRLHAEEVDEFNRRLADEKLKCEERVIELHRMLEFECSQKIKGVEEAHKMEFDAMVKRFKLVNRSVGFGGSCEKIVVQQQQQPQQQQQQVSVILDHHLIQSDSDSESGGGGCSNNVTLAPEPCSGSLERAVDVAACLDEPGVGNETLGSPTSGGDGPMIVDQIPTTNWSINESVVSTATRLHKLSRISISSCRVGGGEANLFYFNEKFNAFTVYLNNKNVHFLNSSDRPEQLKCLKTNAMFIANVTDKEFCVARRPQNRYNVPQGFHFYRVKCKVVEVLDELF